MSPRVRHLTAAAAGVPGFGMSVLHADVLPNLINRRNFEAICIEQRVSSNRTASLVTEQSGISPPMLLETSSGLNVSGGFYSLAVVFWGLGLKCRSRWSKIPTPKSQTVQPQTTDPTPTFRGYR